MKQAALLVLRLTAYGLLSGVVSGAICSLYLHLLNFAIGQVSGIPFYFLVLPLVFLFCTWTNKTLLTVKLPDGQGTDHVIHAYNNDAPPSSLVKGPAKALLSLLTIAAGGSAGKEGPASYLAVVVCTNLARAAKLDAASTKIILVCGLAAGFAAVFGAPIASMLFAIEIMIFWRPQINAAYPALLAALLAVFICRLTGLTYFHQTLSIAWFSPSLLPAVLTCAIFVGALACLYLLGMKGLNKLYTKIGGNDYIKALIAGFIVSLCGLLFGTEALGLGDAYFEEMIWLGISASIVVVLLKIALTSLTLNWGGVGGVITPMFFIGITAGSFFGGSIYGTWLAPTFGWETAPHAFFAAIGLVTTLSVCCKTPLAAIALACEMFGIYPVIYVSIAALLTCLASAKVGIFDSQLVFWKKKVIPHLLD
ncbi:MAG: chloride channel protein [Coriobacteriales bacterium]|jgi:H+/Cl- antiporter ClcA|nr:chloride channel protein [Coriobacteriales bacterium]